MRGARAPRPRTMVRRPRPEHRRPPLGPGVLPLMVLEDFTSYEDGGPGQDPNAPGAPYLTKNVDGANLAVSGLPHQGTHRVVLDVDWPVEVYASSTPGHSHLYIDAPMSWFSYKKLLGALEAAGLIEPGYVDASEERGYTSLRLPWVRKQAEPPEGGPEVRPVPGWVDRTPAFDLSGLFPIGA